VANKVSANGEALMKAGMIHAIRERGRSSKADGWHPSSLAARPLSFSAMLHVCVDLLRGQFIFSFLRRDGQGAIATKKI